MFPPFSNHTKVLRERRARLPNELLHEMVQCMPMSWFIGGLRDKQHQQLGSVLGTYLVHARAKFAEPIKRISKIMGDRTELQEFIKEMKQDREEWKREMKQDREEWKREMKQDREEWKKAIELRIEPESGDKAKEVKEAEMKLVGLTLAEQREKDQQVVGKQVATGASSHDPEHQSGDIQEAASGSATGKSMNNFKKIKELGRGAFGICALYEDVTSNLNKEVVIKRISFNCRKDLDKLEGEVRIMKMLCHPNIITCHHSFVEDEQLCIVLEYSGDGTMKSMIDERNGTHLGEHLILYYFTQVVLALAHMHAKNILHRDLKTVGDFGSSKILKSCPQASTYAGTICYISPEMARGEKYDQKSDIYSLGCVLYELVELRKAFEFDGEEPPMEILTTIALGQHGPFSATMTHDMRNLIEHLLNVIQNRRPNTEEILQKPMISSVCEEINMNSGKNEPDIQKCINATFGI